MISRAVLLPVLCLTLLDGLGEQFLAASHAVSLVD